MALRQGGRVLIRSLMQAKALPERGGGGGPVKYAPPPNKPVSYAQLARGTFAIVM